MTDIHFTDIKMFLLLWLLPLLGLVFFYAAGKRKKEMAAFIDPVMWKNGITGRRPARRGSRFVLFCGAIVFLVIALARPAWNLSETTVKQTGRDVVFMVDVSKSMLATDLKPNRLERAKLAIRDCIEKLQGDRVALVAFAGSAAVKCPLTHDYGFFLMMLEAVSTESIGRGGTLIGDGLRTTVDLVFDDQEKQFKDIILITDGEDHESFPVQAARAAGEEGIRLLIIGLGDEDEGRRIPITTSKGEKSFLKYKGQEVWTKLDGATLRQMAKATPGGRYLPVATGTMDLGEVYLDLVASADRKELESRTISRYEEKFQIFLAAAIVLLTAEALVGRVFLAAFIMLVSFCPLDPAIASPRSLVESGNRAYEKGNFTEAQTLYQEALIKSPGEAKVLFNTGNSLYRQGKFEEAEAAYQKALSQKISPEIVYKSWFSSGNARFQQAENSDDLAEKLQNLKESARFFKKAYNVDPGRQEAGRNLEICRRKIKEIEQLLQKQHQENQQQDPEKKEQQSQEQQQKKQDDTGKNEQQQEEQSDQDGKEKQPSEDNKKKDEPSSEPRQQPGQNSESLGEDTGEAGVESGQQVEDAENHLEGQEQTDATVEAILNAEKRLQQMRRKEIRLNNNQAEKDW